MIPTLFFGIGFLLYCLVILITIDIYSRNYEYPNTKAIALIYIYYSLLAVYVLNLVDPTGRLSEIFVQSMIYLVASAIVTLYYFDNVIKKRKAHH